MKPLKMNADYELSLFSGKAGPQIINHSLEFLLFFLENRPVFSTKSYSPDYLDYVEKVSGHRPLIVSEGDFENYWGQLLHLDRERWWNSKLTSTQFQIEKGWDTKSKIIGTNFDMQELDPELDYLIKDPFGMSGQSFQIVNRHLSSSEKENKILQVKRNGILIAEPLYNRVYDFSHYIYPDKTQIVYQNRVDAKFQYKGTVFSKIHSPYVEHLDFFDEISIQEWKRFEHQKTELLDFLAQNPNEMGFSIDSFVYRDQNKLKIRSISEINYRRTMGRVAFELGQKYCTVFSRVEFALIKTFPDQGPLWKRLKDRNDCLVLSPGDTRFEMLMIFSDTVNQGEERYKELVPNGQLSI